MKCPKCKGSGTLEQKQFYGEEGMKIEADVEYECPACLGFGIIDLKKLEFDVAGIDAKDYPDFCDAYLENVKYNGEFNDDLAEVLNDDGSFVHEQVMNHLF